VHGVGPGSILGGRYTTTVRISQSALHERWRASDHTLEREVILVCFPSGSHVAAAGLDAARQAAGVEDHRLVRVLDVGTDGAVSFIVEEPLTGATALSTLLQAGGLPPDEVRRITGESAQALEKARQRGLHHLGLTPDSILRMPDGEVKIRGLATEAALTDAVRASEERASRLDAIGLVRIAYAGLTGRWPAGGPDAPRAVRGLAPAPTVVGGLAAPSEISVGVPADLDLICRLTLNQDAGPLSPGDLALQIAPWPTSPPASDGASGIGLTPARRGPGATQVLPAVQAPASELYGRLSAGGVGSDAPTLEQPAVRPVPAAEATPRTSLAPAGAPAEPGVAGAAAAAGAAVAGAAGAIGGKVGSFARAAAERASARVAERRAAHDHFEGQDIALTEALDEAPPGELEPPLPLLGHAAHDAPSGAQSRAALAIVAVLVLVALVIGINNVAKIGQSDRPVARPTVTVTATRPSTTTGSSQTSPGQTSTEPPSTSSNPAPVAGSLIVGGKGFDPQDDNTESDNRAYLAFDGDPSTKWESRWYGSNTYNGKKEGVGLVLDLAQPTVLHEVTVTLPGGQDVYVFAANAESLDGAQAIGSISGEDGTVTLRPAKELQPATKVILWVTKPVPSEAPNHYRAQIFEVAVR
jgi:hypothetical protein